MTKTKTKRMELHVVLEPRVEGGFVAYIPELPGCHTQGETRQEALRNIKEAKGLYFEVLESQKAKLNPPRVEVLTLHA